MNKKDVKNILISMRTHDNEDKINNLMGKIDLLSEEKLSDMISQIGNNEESIRNYLEKKIVERPKQNEHLPINKMFTYGISENTVHLHMPVDLHEIIASKGLSKTTDTVNLYLLDAIKRITKLQSEGFYKLDGIESIYMISPILIGRERKFLDELDFQTKVYTKKDLKNDEYIDQNPEAKLAKAIFGDSKNVGTAKIEMDVVNSKKWQEKMQNTVKKFNEKGIVLEDSKSK